MQTELNKVIAAVQEFYAQETFLLERDLGERALTHRLAVYVEKQFTGWQVDCNYDRLGERTLRLPHGTVISTDDHLGKSIYPDIVVHQREIPNNLMAIEARKDSNHQSLEHDQHKLQALTDPHVWFAYWIGVLVILARKGVSFSEVYVGGVVERQQSIWFAERLRECGLSSE
ncbi:hypothetical protein JQ604_41235 [Bradyrhizobium jicamae]|uniref:hypothetical protein n=1 Tax=Bradyrhizobium jicamae TaxID=280332 RepID=UPI001BADC417|nr:hypothetical protein [Bradyrhizobium jicamae]MBR0758644.1 hypothetical protein [Bradyrhizobium jicamae]